MSYQVKGKYCKFKAFLMPLILKFFLRLITYFKTWIWNTPSHVYIILHYSTLPYIVYIHSSHHSTTSFEILNQTFWHHLLFEKKILLLMEKLSTQQRRINLCAYKARIEKVSIITYIRNLSKRIWFEMTQDYGHLKTNINT